MNLAIVGYGKMGRLIEQLAPEYGCSVKLRLDVDNNANFEGLTTEHLRGIDAAVEFSTPAAAPENIERLARLGVNAVIGTTGWFDQMERARAAVERAGTGLGLAICRGFVEAMGGSITAANRIDHSGAVFTIRLSVPIMPRLPVEAIS